jgi:Glycosyltransferase family 87
VTRFLSWRPAPATARALSNVGLAFIALLSVVRGLGLFWPTAIDLHAYWIAGTVTPYANSLAGARDAYLYSPAFTEAFTLLRVALPFQLVVGLWTAAALLVLRWMVPRAWPILLPFFISEIVFGNIHIFLAAMVIVGFRYPGTWAFALLTKVTPGVGLLWFAVRREWRNLAVALGVTAAIAAVSFAIAPGLWAEWAGSLLSNAQMPAATDAFVPISIFLRLPIALLIVVWGARTDRRWTVPIAVLLATPLLWTGSAFVILVAVLPLWRRPLAATLRSPVLPSRSPAPLPV